MKTLPSGQLNQTFPVEVIRGSIKINKKNLTKT